MFAWDEALGTKQNLSAVTSLELATEHLSRLRAIQVLNPSDHWSRSLDNSVKRHHDYCVGCLCCRFWRFPFAVCGSVSSRVLLLVHSLLIVIMKQQLGYGNYNTIITDRAALMWRLDEIVTNISHRLDNGETNPIFLIDLSRSGYRRTYQGSGCYCCLNVNVPKDTKNYISYMLSLYNLTNNCGPTSYRLDTTVYF